MKKTIKKIIGGLVGGVILSGIWIITFLIAIQNSLYYGVAIPILPAILISVFLFIIGATLGAVITK